MQVVTTKGGSSNAQVQAAMDCLNTARSHGTVGSYAGSDGTADSIEILDSLRMSLDAAEDREEFSQRSPIDKDALSELDDFDRRLAHLKPKVEDQAAERQRTIQFEPLPPSDKLPSVRHKAKAPPADLGGVRLKQAGPTPAEILMATKQGHARVHQPFGIGQAI